MRKGQSLLGGFLDSFAAAMAAKFGLSFLVKIRRLMVTLFESRTSRKTNQRMMFLRLAREAEFMFFEANGVMFCIGRVYFRTSLLLS